MFCPNCKTEYRPGVRECSDCHIPLVDTLSGSRAPSGPAADAADWDSPVMLWEGMDPRAFASVRAGLDAKGIPYSDRPQDSPLVRTIARDPLEIWIRQQDEPAGRTIVTDLFGDDPVDDYSATRHPQDSSAGPLADNSPQQDASGAEDSADDEDDEQVDDIVEDFDPRDATCEVWAGSDKQMAQIFDDCLRNVGIGCVLGESAGKTRVLVLPAAEKRAREVIREIVEQSPPK
jgi:hypothetical protein